MQVETVGSHAGTKKGLYVRTYAELEFCSDFKSLTEMVFLSKIIHWSVFAKYKYFQLDSKTTCELLRCSVLYLRKVKKKLVSDGYITEEFCKGYASKLRATPKALDLVGIKRKNGVYDTDNTPVVTADDEAYLVTAVDEHGNEMGAETL